MSVCLCNVDALWPNGWVDQDAAGYRGRPRPWLHQHRLRWKPSSPHRKGHSSPHHFSAHFALARSPISANAELLLPLKEGQGIGLQQFIMSYSSLKRSGWHVLTRDYTVLPATNTFILKWNEPCLPLLPSRRASPHFGRYPFPSR